ncbi:hypothetical protein ACHAXA_007674 [Cyclostephanos tholiformis]|uniref:Uncharacterized protein n=1 Tax=Cyclostephanos tholiformis TaxID=382380 RepID=A0ABD3SDG8_9STRA
MTADIGRIAPLTNIQKIFLQRLLVAHVMTDDDIRGLYASIKDKFGGIIPPPPRRGGGGHDDNDDDGNNNHDGDVDHGYLGNDLDHALGIINASLVPGFELEIRTVSLPPPYVEGDGRDDDDDDDDDDISRNRHGSRRRRRLIRYHAIVNRIDDRVARDHAYPTYGGGPHEMAYFRLVLERIIERGNASGDDDEDGGGGGGGVGCTGALNKMELINLRTELDGKHGDKLTIEKTEMALSCMIEEGWLVRCSPPGGGEGGGGGGGTRGGYVDDDDDDGGNVDGSRKRRNGHRGGGRRRSSSLKGTYYGIGPRSFMELHDFLLKAGLPVDRMPQMILHGI